MINYQETYKQPYIPDVGINYPIEEPDKHILGDDTVDADVAIDENFTFVNKSFWFRVKSWGLYMFAVTVVFTLQTIRFGLIIKGRKHIRQNRKLFKNGAITIANHVLRWDFICVLQAVRFKRPYVIVWKNLLFGKDKGAVKTIRGIPIPETKTANIAFLRSLDELHQRNKWIHVFPESANWHYFQPIRPFKPGAFLFAYRYNVPIIPMAISYRKPAGIYKLLGKKEPLLTLKIGAPILPDYTLDRKPAIHKMLQESHASMCALAGIKNNIYPATFEEFNEREQTKN